MGYLDNSGLSHVITKLKALIASKQDALVSGTNIKTVNGNSLLGSGDLTVGGDVSMTEEEVDAAVEDAFPSMYTITYSLSNLSTDKRVAAEGETVTVTITSMSGYSYFKAVYDSGTGMTTLGSWNRVGTYTFTMPAGDVRIIGFASGGSND